MTCFERLSIASLIIGSAFAGLSGQETAPAEPTQKKTAFEVAVDKALQQYEVFVDGNNECLKPHHALTWNNPIAGGLGKFRTMLFLEDGQPRGVCCFWGGAKNLYLEFGSLTRQTLIGRLDGKKAWEMPAGSQVFKPIPDARPPSPDRRRRMLQMKQMIRRFQAIELRSRKGDPTRLDLRLMPTPLYRYANEVDAVIDGAVFCFVHTTDPEALVVIEAVKDGDAMHWEYAFVRRTTLPVEGQLDGKVVWSTDRVGFKAFNQLAFRQSSR